MSLEYILYLMSHDKPREFVCTDEAFSYYELGVAGYWLMYRQNRLRPDGRRAFYLTDELARALGFEGLHQMHFCLTRVQYWRRFVSVQRLMVALDSYHRRQDEFRQMSAGF